MSAKKPPEYSDAIAALIASGKGFDTVKAAKTKVYRDVRNGYLELTWTALDQYLQALPAKRVFWMDKGIKQGKRGSEGPVTEAMTCRVKMRSMVDTVRYYLDGPASGEEHDVRLGMLMKEFDQLDDWLRGREAE